MTIKTIHREKAFRVSIMGNSLVVNFHGRHASLFTPLSCDYTSGFDVPMMIQEARLMTTGQYSRLSLMCAVRQVESIPESIAR